MREERASRLLRGLLRLYPSEFRSEMGSDLVETALHRWREAHGRSRELVFWATEGVRFGVDGVLERARLVPLLLVDLAYAWRQLVRAPGAHGLAVGTLALGIGATTTIFTVADAVVFRPLPYADAEALYLVHARFGGMELSSNSLLNLQDLQASVKSLSWLAGARDRSPALADALGEPERVAVLDVTPEYLPNLGARVAAGRPFQLWDYGAGAERVVIVSHALWQRRWSGDASVLGRSVRLDGRDHVIVGVMHPRFRDPEPIESGAVTDAWIPTRAGSGAFQHRDDYSFRVLGRLAEGASVASAREELSAAGARLASSYPEANRMGADALDFVLHPLREMTIGEARARVLLLLGAVVLLLVLACTNVAGLFLARGLTRGSELAVRGALGGTRARLGVQLFAESLLTAGAAGAIGALISIGGVHLFRVTAPPGIPRLHEVALNSQVLVFVIVLTVLTAVAFGTVPALRGSRAALASVSGIRITAGRSTQRLQAALVAAGVAVSLVLVTSSALLLNSVRHMLSAEPGFDVADVMHVEIRPPESSRTRESDVAFYRALVDRASVLRGVETAGLMQAVPGVAGGAWSHVTIDTEAARAAPPERSRAPAYGGDAPGAEFIRMNPVYGAAFEALDIPVLAGRTFSGDPGSSDALVVVVNEAAARRLFGTSEPPLGRRLMLGTAGSDAPLREIVGVVADVRQRGVGQAAEPQIYVPYGQRNINRLSLVLELKSGAVLDAAAIRQLVRDIAPDLPIDRIEPLSARYAAAGQQARFLALLVSVFACIGLALALVGTYATAAQTLARRRRELGIRTALGARAGALFRLVLGRAFRLALAGIAAGLVVTLLLARFLDAHVYGITARDPATFAAAALLMAASAGLASLQPALRAARVDPNEVLRSE